MTKYKDLKLIDSVWLDNRIKGYKEYLKSLPQTEENVDGFKIHRAIISEYEVLKSKLIDATPILTETFTIGYNSENQYKYSRNLEQFLNTEVKL